MDPAAWRAPGPTHRRFDQQHRIVAYERVEGELAALVVAYGIATDDVLADWRTLLP